MCSPGSRGGDWPLEAATAGGAKDVHFVPDGQRPRRRVYDPPISLPQSHPIAFCNLMAVVTSTFNSPASMLYKVRMFKSAFSARRSWVRPAATRSRRTFAPKAFNWAEICRFVGTVHCTAFQA